MDYVTEADTGAQRRIIDRIRETYDEATTVGEEEDEPKSIPDHGDAWIVDPIDGTTNFVHGIPSWTTAVAVVRDGETQAAATIAPVLNDVFHADTECATRNGRPISVSEKDDPETFMVAPVLRYGPDTRRRVRRTHVDAHRRLRRPVDPRLRGTRRDER